MSSKSFVVRDPNYVERVRDAFSRQGFLQLIHARVEELAPGRCVIAADFRGELAQQNGFFHGGYSVRSPTRRARAPQLR